MHLSSRPASPPILDHIAPLLGEFDVLVCDIWGVVHDGARAYAAAGDAFARFRASGGTVLLLSNAPMPGTAVAEVLDEKGVRRDTWDAIVASGDITLAHIAARGYRRVHHVGPARDDVLFRSPESISLSMERVDLDRAEAIVCTGLVDDRRETAADYRPLLERALDRRLPLICANPDLVVDVGGALLVCAGAIAEVYEEMGGPVHWAGKPHAPAYEMALATVARLRGAPVAKSRVLAIGDAVRTDLAGAHAFGLASVFIGQGIHRDEVLRHGRISPVGLEAVLSGQPARPIAAMVGIAW